MKFKTLTFYCCTITIMVFFSIVRIQANDDLILYPESIMHLTMENSPRIQAAKYQLESARYNFKLFESEYTQFTPFQMNSDIQGNNEKTYEGNVSAGIDKEFFDGTSLSASIGQNNEWGEGVAEEVTQYIKTEVQFPLFSSNRKLERVIKRTFEENELYSAHLDYVNTIRNTIREALEQYYDYVPRLQILERLKSYKSDLMKIEKHPQLGNRPFDQEQIQGEVNRLTSEIQGWEIEVQSLLIAMKYWSGLPGFENYDIQCIDIDFDDPKYFGKYYVMAPHAEILERAIQNDTELKVLEIIQKNAVEKKKLAEKGKWDIFFSAEGKYNFNEQVEQVNHAPYYEALAGLNIKRFDKTVLHHTIQKAEADIQHILATMEDRRLEMDAEINQEKVTLLTRKEQVLNNVKSLESWQSIHDTKLEQFLKGDESADNYIQSFRSLLDTMEDGLFYINDYLDTIRDFEYICGVYFTVLDIDTE